MSGCSLIQLPNCESSLNTEALILKWTVGGICNKWVIAVGSTSSSSLGKKHVSFHSVSQRVLYLKWHRCKPYTFRPATYVRIEGATAYIMCRHASWAFHGNPGLTMWVKRSWNVFNDPTTNTISRVNSTTPLRKSSKSLSSSKTTVYIYAYEVYGVYIEIHG